MSIKPDSCRLADTPCFAVCFVETDLEHLADYFRGEACEVERRGGHPSFEVRGDAAGIGGPFGYDSSLIVNPFKDEIPYLTGVQKEKMVRNEERILSRLPEWYPLRGRTRLSRLRCNPRWIMIEQYCNSIEPVMEHSLQQWTHGATYRFISQIGRDPTEDMGLHYGIDNATGPGPGPTPQLSQDRYFIHHLMTYVAPGAEVYDTTRYVQVYRDDRMKFTQSGKLLPFEKPETYQVSPPRNRLTRDIICSYLDAIGIDPEATFGRRELDDPILFTSDHPGIPCLSYTEHADRYRRFERDVMNMPDYD